MKNLHISPAQQLILNAILSAAGGAATAGVTAATQYYTSNGFNVPALINVFVAASFVLFGKTLYDFVPGHIQTILQAYQDTIADLRNVQVVNATPIQQASVAPSQSQPGPYVVIHAGQGATVAQASQQGQTAYIPALATTTQSVNTYTPVVSQNSTLADAHAQVQQIPFPVQSSPSDILGNIPSNSSVAQALPLNGVTGQYAIYGVTGQ